MVVAASKVSPFAPIFAVEVVDVEGFAWLYGPVYLHEALKISASFERETERSREPRVTIPPPLVGLGLTEK